MACSMLAHSRLSRLIILPVRNILYYISLCIVIYGENCFPWLMILLLIIIADVANCEMAVVVTVASSSVTNWMLTISFTVYNLTSMNRLSHDRRPHFLAAPRIGHSILRILPISRFLASRITSWDLGGEIIARECPLIFHGYVYSGFWAKYRASCSERCPREKHLQITSEEHPWYRLHVSYCSYYCFPVESCVPSADFISLAEDAVCVFCLSVFRVNISCIFTCWSVKMCDLVCLLEFPWLTQVVPF